MFAYANLPRTQNLSGRINFHRFLRLAAEMILKIECAGAGVKIGGSVTGLVGTGMVIAGNTLSLLYFKRLNILVKVFKNGPSKICGRQFLKNLK